jgi:maleylacetate reductase
MILQTLPVTLANPHDLAARTALQEGAWLAGLCLGQTRMGLAHQLVHVLGGACDLPHAALHTVLLPHVMGFALPAAPVARDRLQELAGADPGATLAALVLRHGGPTSLQDLGVPAGGHEDVAARVLAAPYPSPRVVRDVLLGAPGSGLGDQGPIRSPRRRGLDRPHERDGSCRSDERA